MLSSVVKLTRQNVARLPLTLKTHSIQYLCHRSIKNSSNSIGGESAKELRVFPMSYAPVKLMKPIHSSLRLQGHLLAFYIDDNSS